MPREQDSPKRASSLRLLCWIHRMGNGLASVPEHMSGEVKGHVAAIRYAPTLEAGEGAAKELVERFAMKLPSACARLSDDLNALLNHLREP